MGLPVVIIRGILESGKTTFITDSLVNGDFGDVGRALVISQEDGEIEYDANYLKTANATHVILNKLSDWNENNINDIISTYKPQVVFIETNEMWDFNNLTMPRYFDIQQTITIIDGETFSLYLANMRQKFNDMVRSSDLVIINRCTETPATSQLKRNVKMMNQNAYVIAVDYTGKQLNLPSDLPFKVDGEEITLTLSDFGAWYIDTFESKARYENKIVEFDCMAMFNKKLPPRSFIAGRMAMTCCADDIQVLGHLCAFPKGFSVKNKSWIHLKARVHYMKFANGEERVVLEMLSADPIASPDPEDALVKLV
ncbi:MAG: hypothetical protein J6R88_05910 [Clostridia bacterium]|nr:hypothetical protein [Clostridia bacterium]